MPDKSFSNVLWEGAIQSWGALIAFVGFFITVISWLLADEEISVSLKTVLVVFTLMLWFCIVSIRTAWISYKRLDENSSLKLPKVVTAISPTPAPYEDNVVLFLVAPTVLLSYDATVSIFYLEGSHEKFVALGKVTNIQEDKLVQLVVTDDYNFGDELESIKNNSSNALNNLILKTTIPSFIINTRG